MLLPDLVVHAARAEVGEGAREGDLAPDGEARGNAHHVGLGDAHLEEAFRVLLLRRHPSSATR
jgi:hypothetical protein